jgi:hypothetical protein
LFHLHQVYVESLGTEVTTLKLYRGYGISTEDLTLQIQDNLGGFISMTCFTSTSVEKNVSLTFAKKELHSEGKEAILLEIEVDVRKCRTPFANTRDLSAHSQKHEIPFTMGAVFRVEAVLRGSEGVGIVKLKLTGEEDE